MSIDRHTDKYHDLIEEYLDNCIYYGVDCFMHDGSKRHPVNLKGHFYAQKFVAVHSAHAYKLRHCRTQKLNLDTEMYDTVLPGIREPEWDL